MEGNNMIDCVKTLLNSDIQSNLIVKATGINKATLSNLRRGNNDISKASFETVNKLYKFYLEKEEYLNKAKDVEADIININIPKDIHAFILNLKKSIDEINEPNKSLCINEILIEKKFTLSKDKKSVKLISLIKIDELIPVQIKRNTFAYNLKIIRDYIDNSVPIENILNYQIMFDYNDLEIALKRMIHNGNKVTLIKSNLDELGNSRTGLFVNNVGYNFEYNFMDIHIISDHGEGERDE
ncbi:hypothetical protein [Staphylococcus hyicus]|uniref:hypothetical protein n=1 Tax=Staphylococcus hyicus TaxID=1284 RepID=UPI003132F3B5